MSVIFLLIPLSMVVATCFLAAFIWAVRSGQYEDTCTPSLRVLLDEGGNPMASGRLASNPPRLPACAPTADDSTSNQAPVGPQSGSSKIVEQ